DEAAIPFLVATSQLVVALIVVVHVDIGFRTAASAPRVGAGEGIHRVEIAGTTRIAAAAGLRNDAGEPERAAAHEWRSHHALAGRWNAQVDEPATGVLLEWRVRLPGAGLAPLGIHPGVRNLPLLQIVPAGDPLTIVDQGVDRLG